MEKEIFLAIGVALAGWAMSGVLVRYFNFGPWGRLARLYRSSNKHPDSLFGYRMVGGAVGWSSFRNGLNIYPHEKGLFLDTICLNKPWHVPLFIPWSAIVRAEQRKAFVDEYVVLYVGDPLISKISLPQEVGLAVCKRGSIKLL